MLRLRAYSSLGGALVDRDRIETAYEILGVPESAPDAEIHSAFMRLANEYHPDKLAALATRSR
jgi:DnaJ-class molecular chaperone